MSWTDLNLLSCVYVMYKITLANNSLIDSSLEKPQKTKEQQQKKLAPLFIYTSGPAHNKNTTSLTTSDMLTDQTALPPI